jgi:SAM-dependent methyltransferase
MIKTHNYTNYNEYVLYQLEKTSDKEKQSKWLGPEWNEKIDIFTKLFKSNIDLIQNKKNAICLGSRTGQEVVALKNIGITNCIGIDLHEFKPYTIKGDIHKLDFSDNSFDLAFSNIFDHSLYPEIFASETYRVLEKDGIFILHVQLGIDQDKYTELIIENKDNIIEIFKNFKLIKEGPISSGKIAMNYEYIFKKC